MGPQELGGYFKQQFRWALGTIGLFRKTILEFFFRPGNLGFHKVWEYILSGTYYFTGWVFLLLWIMPVLYIFFGVPSIFAYPEIFLTIFFPYLILTLFTFLLTLRQRGYGSRDLFIGIILSSVTFPVYIKASVLGMLGVKGSFGITPKSGSDSLPLRDLWPQTALLLIGFAAIVWAVNRYFYTGLDGPALLVNALWCAYNVVILSVVYYFNRPDET
jgi:cellulose synthase (UDP-forming)